MMKWRPPLPFLTRNYGLIQIFHSLLPIMDPISIENLEGKRISVDAYSLLYKAADLTGCCREIALGIQTHKHIEYCMDMVELLLRFASEVTFVFHGCTLPMLKYSEGQLESCREENLKNAILHDGDNEICMKYYRKAFCISPVEGNQLLVELRDLKNKRVKFTVAPYDANAQLTFLLKKNIVEAVITEDPSLILFGNPKIIFNMSKDGDGLEFQISKVENLVPKDTTLFLSGFNSEMVRDVCLFSGCNYTTFTEMNFTRACDFLKQFKGFYEVVEHILGTIYATDLNTLSILEKAMWAFQCQRVYDPEKKEMVYLAEFPKDAPKYFDATNLDFLGPYFPKKDVIQLAEGMLNPLTMQPFEMEIQTGEETEHWTTFEVIRAKFFPTKEDELLYLGFCIEEGILSFLSSCDEDEENAESDEYNED